MYTLQCIRYSDGLSGAKGNSGDVGTPEPHRERQPGFRGPRLGLVRLVFRRQAASTGDKRWLRVNPTLYAMNFSARKVQDTEV